MYEEIKGLRAFHNLSSSIKIIEPYSEGRGAKRDRKPVTSCPYPKGENRTKWMEGFHSKVKTVRTKRKFRYTK